MPSRGGGGGFAEICPLASAADSAAALAATVTAAEAPAADARPAAFAAARKAGTGETGASPAGLDAGQAARRVEIPASSASRRPLDPFLPVTGSPAWQFRSQQVFLRRLGPQFLWHLKEHAEFAWCRPACVRLS